MERKKVALITNRSLLASGVLRLLRNAEGLEVLPINADDPECDQKIRIFAPSVIILDSGDPRMGQGMAFRLLNRHPEATVAALNLNRTDLQIYRMDRVIDCSPEELLEVLGANALPAPESKPPCPRSA